MRWEVWKPWYERIVEELRLDRDEDVLAARLIDEILPKPRIGDLARIIEKRECIVFGSGPSLDVDLEKLEKAGYLDKVLISADGATSAVMHYRNPDVIVTDLDGRVEDQLMAWERGAWMVVHAHGDNIEAVLRVVPKMSERVIGSTQVKPFGKLFNFGGFTDGDRGAFLAHELGASKIYLAGMDFGPKLGKYSFSKNPSRTLAKLRIGKGLFAWLAGGLNANIVNLTSGGASIPNVPHKKLA